MNFEEFFRIVYEFVKKLLTYLGEWPFSETEEENTEADA